MPTVFRPPFVWAALLGLTLATTAVARAGTGKPGHPPVTGHEVVRHDRAAALRLRTVQRAAAQDAVARVPDGITAVPMDRGALAASGGRFSDDVVVVPSRPVDRRMRQCVTEDGTIFGVFLSDDANTIQVQRSEDGGRTWAWYAEWIAIGVFGPPDVAVAGGNLNRLIVVAARGIPTVDSALVMLSLDLDAEDYGPQAILADDHDAGYVAPRICMDSPEYSLWYPYVTYHRSDATGDRLMFTRSTDFGVTWQTPVELSQNAWRFRPASLDFGGSVLTVAFTGATELDIFVTQSGDFGTVFTPPVAVAATELEETGPVVAAANDGSMTVVAFTRFYPGTLTDVDCVWNDGGAVWNPAYLPYTDDADGWPDLSFSPDGTLLHATYLSRARVVYTQAESPATTAWSDPRRINDAAHHIDAEPQIVAWNTPCGCDPDLTCDGVVDEWDRLALETAIADPHGYEAMFPDCDIAAGDLDCDGDLDAADLACFDDGLSCCPGGEYQDANVLWPGEGDPIPILADQVRTYFPDPVTAAPVAAAGLRLDPARPNPFNARTSIAFHLPTAGPATLEIHAPDGRRVVTLASGEFGAGDHVLGWDGRDRDGRNCSSGIYLVRLESAAGTATQRLVMVK
jgi:hypothetical protein